MRSPKTSPQPWPLPPSWRWAAIGEIAVTKNGDVARLKGADFPGSEVPWLRGSELRDNFVSSTTECIAEPAVLTSGATVFPKGTVCIARSGSGAGRLGILQIPAVANTTICGILPSNALWPEFLFRFLQFERPNLASRRSRANQPYITLSALRATSIPVAPINQQRRVSTEIASRLAHLDSRSHQLNHVLSDLKRNRGDIFTAVLNHHLASSGWLPPQSGSRAEPPAGSLPGRIFGDANRGDKIGRISTLPDGWMLKTAQQTCAEITCGWDVQSAYEITGQLLVTTKGVTDGGIDFSVCGFISDALFERHKRHCSPQKDDILLVGRGQNIGRTALVESDAPFVVGRDILLLRPLTYPRYLFQWLRSRECQRWIQRGTGEARGHLRLSEIRRMPVLLPPAAEQVQIVAEIDEHLLKINRLKAAILALRERAESIRLEILNLAFQGTLPCQRIKKNPNRHARRMGKLQIDGKCAEISLSRRVD